MYGKTFENIYQSPFVRATAAFALLALAGNWLAGGCAPPRVEGDRLSFSGTDLEGRPVSLDGPGYRGKVLLVDIWGLWCPMCIQSVPILIDLKKQFGDEGFEVVGLEFAEDYAGSRDQYKETLRAWVKERGINYPVVQAGMTSERAAMLPGLKSFQGYPTGVIIGRDGTVRHIETGIYAGSARDLEAVIGPLLRERIPQQ